MKKKIFMLRKLWRDIINTPPASHIDHKSELGYYYLKFINHPKKLNRLIAKFDDDGVPLNNSYIDVEDSGYHYYPITIGQYGLAVFHDWLDHGLKSDKDLFLRIADWFQASSIIDQELGAYWLTDVDKPEFNIKHPWKSAFSQSRGLSILLRAHQLDNSKGYYDMAKLAIKPYYLDISAGGVRTGNKHEYIFEEYVADLPTRILDGAIFSLLGVAELIRSATHHKDDHTLHKAKEIWQQGIDGLKYWLPKYDMGFWAYYNKCEIPGYPTNDPCTIGYLKLVIVQLEIIYGITGDAVFDKYKRLFQSYLRPKNIIKMYKLKYTALQKLNRL